MDLRKLITRYKNKALHLMSIAEQLENFRYDIRRAYLEDKIMRCVEPGISTQRYCDHQIIVSLTTYGRRLIDVCFTIESIMQQTMLPNRIILNLDPVSSNDPLPISLQKQMKRGLEVAVVDDIRSYKKLIPTLRSNPNAIIITVDDDLLYDFDIIERLYNSYVINPTDISALRTHTIMFDNDMNPLSYNDWKMCCADAKNKFHLFPTTGGGTLYPPNSLSQEVFNQDVFTSICPTADDVWFHAMALLNGTGIVKVQSRNHHGEDYIINESVQDMGLCTLNVGPNGQNDIQIKAVYDRYGIPDLLKKNNAIYKS